ncbi:hypothetical protein COY28_03470 [Candidatus Woesearchaeota archaeon CG_4_10_14_0_2_um_filter_57_5]|nr:MAG: hypothetical protein COY28_03470 [Candidatus Woesearchaeota archaeon CG_4_10_14_0_2_um_filter_57_5]
MLTDVSVSNGCNFATWAIRKFSDDDSSTIVGYRLSASPNGENGLTFSYRVNTTHPDGPCKYTQVELTDMDPTLVCRVTEGYDSSLPASRAFLPDSKEEAVLTFLANGVFGSVHGVSQTNARNPDWTDDTLQRLLRRGSNEQFSYTADTADGAFLANEVFGIDASKHPRLNAQATLTTLMDLAIRGERMDLNRDLQFL